MGKERFDYRDIVEKLFDRSHSVTSSSVVSIDFSNLSFFPPHRRFTFRDLLSSMLFSVIFLDTD